MSSLAKSVTVLLVLLLGALLPAGPATATAPAAPIPADRFAGGAPGWDRLAPGYVGYALDVADDGELVFVGHEFPPVCESLQAYLVPATEVDCMLAVVADERCEAMGCSLYRYADGQATLVATEQIDEDFDQAEMAYGFSDVAVSPDGSRIAATALGGQADVGRLWRVTGTQVTRMDTESPTFAVTTRKKGFWAVAGPGVGFRIGSAFRQFETGVGCALYDVVATASGVIVTGFGGTYRLGADGSTTRIGAPGEAVWASPDGSTVYVAVSTPPNTVVVTGTTDGGKTWTRLPFVDPAAAPDEQVIVTGIERDGHGTVWAVGGSRTVPAAYLWRLEGASFVRVPGPADDATGPYTDAAVTPDGRLAVASRLGMYAQTG